MQLWLVFQVNLPREMSQRATATRARVETRSRRRKPAISNIHATCAARAEAAAEAAVAAAVLRSLRGRGRGGAWAKMARVAAGAVGRTDGRLARDSYKSRDSGVVNRFPYSLLSSIMVRVRPFN